MLQDFKGKGHLLSKWERYITANDELAVELFMADLGYAGMLGVSVADMYGLKFAQGRSEQMGAPVEMKSEQLSPFSRGRMGLAEDALYGTRDSRIGSSHMRFASEPGRRRVRARVKDFHGGKDLELDLKILCPERERPHAACSLKDSSGSFIHTQRSLGLPVRGSIELGESTVSFDSSKDTAIFERGKAVYIPGFQYLTAVCSTYISGKPFAFSLSDAGAGAGSICGNALYYDGKEHKPGEVFFCIPDAEYGTKDYMGAWSLTSPEGRFEAVFIPDHSRDTKLGRSASAITRKQVIGRITGTAVLDEGSEIKLRDELCIIDVAS